MGSKHFHMEEDEGCGFVWGQASSLLGTLLGSTPWSDQVPSPELQ